MLDLLIRNVCLADDLERSAIGMADGAIVFVEPDRGESAREEPGKESDRTLRLLDSLGYRIDDELIMARYVRAVGPERRKEIIFFYMEPPSRTGNGAKR